MNATVDLNEMRVLLLLILLTAEICYEVKDMHRAFFFYNQGVKIIEFLENCCHLYKFTIC